MFDYKYTDTEIKKLIKSIVILADTREQQNQHLINYFDKNNIIYKNQKLDCGDYSFYLPKNEELSIQRDIYFDKKIVFERKASLEELSNNLSHERDRFEKELSIFNGKMYLLIENANYSDIVEGKYKTNYNKKSYLATLHTFIDRYNIYINFMSNNQFSGMFIYYTFVYYLRNCLK